MALRAFYNEMKNLKLREVPSYLKPKLTVENVKNTVVRSLDQYNEKYIQTGSAVPLYHICFYGMAFCYVLHLPEERRHLAHKEQHGHH